MPYKTASAFLISTSAFFCALAAIVIAVREKIAAVIERRKTRSALNELDDYMLKDMGIARSDIERIAKRTYSPR